MCKLTSSIIRILINSLKSSIFQQYLVSVINPYTIERLYEIISPRVKTD